MAAGNAIRFFFEKIAIPGFNEEKAREWVKNAVEKEGSSVAGIQVIFCHDELLVKINRKYLKHDTLTDIITFNYNDEFDGIAGDIFISYDRVEENAALYSVSSVFELHRVIIHGVLHLLGYDDEQEDDLHEMRAKENYYLNLLFIN